MKYKITLNNKTYEVEVEKGEATLLSEYKTMAPETAPEATTATAPAPVAASAPVSQGNGKAFPSPLPGVVLGIKAQVGQQVHKGDVVIVIEAMKMENEISAPSDGKVSAICVKNGQKVEIGTPLFEIA